ncbi:MAG: DUF5682 family protein [Bacteroidota bacterium]
MPNSPHIFGIRHHGQGSAKRLKKALKALEPDCILLEAPQDAEKILEYVAHPKLKPPVAMLLYQPTNLQKVSYLPFASFSPEWIAMKYGLDQEIPIRFMDLPMALQYGVEVMERDQLKELLKNQQQTEVHLVRDPLGYMAQLAGYSDGERWWNTMFEQQDDQVVFETILEMMQTLRAGIGRMESAETLRREAFMRKTLRKAQKDGFQRIAIVCGAWHSPIFTDLKKYPNAKDNALLKGIKKVKVAATWVPWTYERLVLNRQYGAGVISPAWYELLFKHQKEETSRWMTRAARLLRNEKMNASAAHAMEAVRLAETLATMRGLHLPGMEELKEAAVTVLCEGSEEKLALIEQKLIVGDRIGNVPDSVPVVPLQKDLEKQIKATRLTKYWKAIDKQWLKATSANPRGGLDFRNEADQAKSHLLHRLNILGINWGTVQKEGRFDKGSFKEYWKLKWKPDFIIKLIERSVWGSTVQAAATQYLKQKIEQEGQLQQLSELLETVLYADLPETTNALIHRLREQAALTEDVLTLMSTLPPLVSSLRYGTTRQVNLLAIKELVEELVPRICVGLPPICLNVEEDFAEEIIAKTLAVHTSIHLLQEDDLEQQWYQSLLQILDLQGSLQAKIEGTVVRLLFDRKVLDIKEAKRKMHFNCSIGHPPLKAVLWLEGFLHGSGLLLVHYVELWQILDDWLKQLSHPEFQETLPLLRRAFSNFSHTERRKMLHRAKHGLPKTNTTASIVKQEQKEAVAQTVGALLGWEAK